MSANWPRRRDEGTPAELEIESGSAGPPDGGLDGDGSGTMATHALFNPPIPARFGSITIFPEAEHAGFASFRPDIVLPRRLESG
jgi:hypothetical protein